MQLPIISTKAAFAQFSETLQAQGIREALAYLLSLTEYRFIGVFGFGSGMTYAIAHYDRENPDALDGDSAPDVSGYGDYVRDCKRSFVTADATMDERLRKHPARNSVPAYCGVPVMDPDGAVLGSLCHYDIVPREKQIIRHPDILILEGLNVLQTGPALMVSDLFDFSVYVDARIEDIEQWYISRFLSMRAGAFADPASHFHHYSTLTDEQAVFAASDIWNSINRPNLIDNILPTRPRATLVLRKDADHSINRLRLRKL